MSAQVVKGILMIAAGVLIMLAASGAFNEEKNTPIHDGGMTFGSNTVVEKIDQPVV